MEHDEVPDEIEDAEYLRFVHAAARAGSTEVMTALGDFAWMREDLVETYYWLTLLSLRGVDVKANVTECRKAWMEAECPDEEEAIRHDFEPAQHSFALAALNYDCGTDRVGATEYFRAVAEDGDTEAAAFLSARGFRK